MHFSRDTLFQTLGETPFDLAQRWNDSRKAPTGAGSGSPRLVSENAPAKIRGEVGPSNAAKRIHAKEVKMKFALEDSQKHFLFLRLPRLVRGNDPREGNSHFLSAVLAFVPPLNGGWPSGCRAGYAGAEPLGGIMKCFPPAVLLLLLLAGCSSPVSPVSTATQPSGPQEYGSVEDLRDAFIAAGGGCSFWEQNNYMSMAAGSAFCGEETVLSIYTSEENRDSAVATLVSDADLFGGVTLLVGPNWVVSSPDSSAVRAELGGTLVTK